MSQVTNIILYVSCPEISESEIIENLNLLLVERGYSNFVDFETQGGKGIEGWYAGNKMLEADLYLGAFNYFDLESFVAGLKNIDYGQYSCVQLMVMEQDDENGFRFIKIKER